MDGIETAHKLDGLVAAIGLMATDIALVKETSSRTSIAVDKLQSQLYNGGKGDITRILRRLTRLEKTKTMFSGVLILFGGIGSFSAFLLAAISIAQKLGWMEIKPH